MKWYEDKNGHPKSHRKSHTCKDCRDNPTGGCILPFRKQRKVRWLKQLDKKPMFFGSLWFNNFIKSRKKNNGI